MRFRDAKRLHNEDEVTIKETNEVVTVLQSYQSENGKHIIVECDDGNTYYNNEIRWNRNFNRKMEVILWD